MRAVNLIPAESRRASAPAGRSGGAAHGVLGVLAVAVIAVALLTLTSRQAAERRAEAVRVTTEAQVVEARLGALRPYRQVTEMALARTQRVRELADARFDWSFALTEVARVVPRGVRLVGLVGTVAPGAAAGGGAGALRSASPGPAIEMTGCAPGQARTALLLARLRALDGVRRVALASSAKAAAAQGGSAAASSAGGAAQSDDCRHGSDRIPRFELGVFFRSAGTAPADPAATSAGSAG